MPGGMTVSIPSHAMLVNIHTHSPRVDEIAPTFRGIHPSDAGIISLAEVMESLPQAEAIGEIGLDKCCPVPMNVQTEVFEEQVSMAEKLGKPVIIHSVRTFEPVMKILGRHRIPNVIFHGFVGSAEQMLLAVEKGYYISFGFGSLRSPRTVLALRLIPDKYIFLETDTSNRPIVEMYAHAASVRRTGIDHLEEVTTANFNTIFRP